MTADIVKPEPSSPAAQPPLGARERMILSALFLMGENGVDGTSFSQVIEHSGAPRGSIYHHFPGGKAQLVEEAVRYAGDVMARGFAELDKSDPLAALRSVSAYWRAVLHNNEFAAGCPVLAATLESDELPGAREAARETFQRFQSFHVELLTAAGLPEERARSLAAVAVSAVEGAVILSRAERSTEPLDRVLDELEISFTTALRGLEPTASQGAAP